MKKLLTLALVLLMGLGLSAQKFAFVDTKYILDKIPEYAKAQEQLDVLAENWKKEIDQLQMDVDRLYKKFQREQYLMDEITKQQRIEEIEKKEVSIREARNKKFGFEGELFQKRQELVQPIQDKVYNEIQKLAKEVRYEFIFDKSTNGAYMLYADPKNDRSDDILKALGY